MYTVNFFFFLCFLPDTILVKKWFWKESIFYDHFLIYCAYDINLFNFCKMNLNGLLVEELCVYEINVHMVISCREPTKTVHYAHFVVVVKTQDFRNCWYSLNEITNTMIYISMIYNNKFRFL
jgi:hypothetical protein